ncbi:MAG: hypothetical protein WCH99_10865 [Verrucomicrobiota bacterium]
MRTFTLVFALALAASGSGAELRLNFGDYAEGSTPTNFSYALFGAGKPGIWKVVMDTVPSAFAPLTDKAPSVTRHGVLAQTSQDMSDEHFLMFVYDNEVFRNFKLATRFKIISGVAEQMAGVVFRYQNASNFYVVRASALGKNVRFYKVVNGLRSDPIGPALNVSAGVWHTLAVQCEGNQISIFYDDKPVMPPLGDNSFAEGKAGFWTKSDSVSYFSDAVVNYTPRVPVAQVLVNSVMEKQPRIVGLRIYTLATTNTTRIIASKDPTEVGQPGTEAELAAIQSGTVSFGREKGEVLVTLPLHDRNGEDIAAVHVRLNSFWGETQDNAVNRATLIRKIMQSQCSSAEELLK